MRRRTFAPRSRRALKMPMSTLGLGATLRRLRISGGRASRVSPQPEIAAGNLSALLGLAEMRIGRGRISKRRSAAVSKAGDKCSTRIPRKRMSKLPAPMRSPATRTPRWRVEESGSARARHDPQSCIRRCPRCLLRPETSGQAIEEQRTALQLLDGDADGWNNLGVLESRTGKTAAARADFEHALRLQPDHPQAKANLAHLHGEN